MAYVYYNPNPAGKIVGDCSVRAVSKALDVDWDAAYIMITCKGFVLHDMPSSDAVWGSVLRDHGFQRDVIPNTCPDCYTADDFSRDHQKGVYVLGFGEHVATIVDGNIYDSWDSSKKIAIYFWHRKDD